MEMVREGLIDRDHYYGTINCDGVNAKGEVCGVTTTSGLAWKIPGRAGDSPILGAGLYVDGEVGAAGSTGRGEANLYNLSSFLIVEEMRRGAHPKDAAHDGAEARREEHDREAAAQREGPAELRSELLLPECKGEYAGVSMYGTDLRGVHRERRRDAQDRVAVRSAEPRRTQRRDGLQGVLSVACLYHTAPLGGDGVPASSPTQLDRPLAFADTPFGIVTTSARSWRSAVGR